MKFTQANYLKAIRSLYAASKQLEPDGRPCAICHDTDHQAFECHHNPLVWKEQAENSNELLNNYTERLNGVNNATG